VKRVIRQKEQYEAADLWIWAWLDALLRHLGEGGMSSDETDADDHGNISFAVKKLPWRTEIERPLKMIDEKRKEERSVQNRKGAKPTPRIRHKNKPCSERLPPQHMPEGVFDKNWLEEADTRNIIFAETQFHIQKLD
jgi:hypothetical protein